MASNVLGMASNLPGMASNVLGMAFNPLGMASKHGKGKAEGLVPAIG